MALILSLVGLAGVVVFSILYVIAYFKDGSFKLPATGMGACFALVVAVAALTYFEIGPFGDSVAGSIEMKVGESSRLDTDTDSESITFESSDNTVAAVDGSGTVTAVSVGTATITATNEKGRAAKYNVTVSHVQPTAIEFSPAELIVAPSQTVSVEAVFTPENTSERSLEYSIDQADVATVDDSGTVTGVSQGSATLTATAPNGLTATCTITVVSYADSITIEPSLEMTPTEKGTLTVAYAPDNSAPEEIIWTSSDESIATVTDGQVTAVGVGTATITAETLQSHLTASCTVTVGYAELTITSFNSGGYSATSTSSVGIGGWTSSSSYKTIGFEPKVTVSGGSGGYQYKFDIIKNGSIVKTSGWQSSANSEFTFSTGGTYTARVTVRDSQGQTATASETATIS